VFDTDVFVAGGGPAGLATAIAARRKGLRVIVADGARRPVDKACGEGIMPDGLSALSELGVSLAFTAPAPFRGIRFIDEGITAEAVFPSGNGLGVRRAALHNALSQAAESAGAELLWGTPVNRIAPDGILIGRQLVKSRWIVGADGLRSRVRAWAGLERVSRVPRYLGLVGRFAFRRHFHWHGRLEYMELHWGQNFQVYVTPVGATEACVVVISRDAHLRLEQAFVRFPRLTERLGEPSGPAEAGAVTAMRRLRRVTRDPIALVGDASGSVDAITGEGLCLAFHQALALATALEREDLMGYERAHRRLMRRPALMGALLLSLEPRPWLRRRVFRAFGARPALFEKMLAVHVGALKPVDLAAAGLALSRQILGRSRS
jgi:menaquinone-9 beta-reductase